MHYVHLSRRLRVFAAALLVAMALAPGTAFAQGTLAEQPARQGHGRLYWPTIAAGSAATADWITTYHAIKFYKVQEQNPFLKPLQSNPGRMVSVGALMDVAGVSAWNLTVGRNHQKMAAAGLWTMTAFRVFLAIHNHNNEHRAERRDR